MVLCPAPKLAGHLFLTDFNALFYQHENLSAPFYARLALVLFSIICLGYLAILGHSLLAPMMASFLLAWLLLYR